MAKNHLLKEPKSFLGSKPLLFYRLIDDKFNEHYESTEYSLLSKDGVKDSLQLELTRLLNTRSSGLTFEDIEDLDKEKTPYGIPSFYGIPDFSTFDITSTNEWTNIARAIKKAIDYFEPRLKNVNVEVETFDALTQALHVRIMGTLNIKKMEGEVTFNIAVECTGEK